LIWETNAADKKTVDKTDLNNRCRKAFLLKNKSPVIVKQSGSPIDKDEPLKTMVSRMTERTQNTNNMETFLEPRPTTRPSKTDLKKEL
jgi:hypothetical protein